MLVELSRLSVRNWLKDALFRRLFQNVGVLLGGDVVSRLFGLVSLTLTARALGAEQFGMLVLIESYVLIVDRLVNFQSWQALIKFGAEALEQKRHEEFKSLIKLSTLLDFSSAMLGAVIAAGAAHHVGRWLHWDPQAIQMATVYSLTILFNLAGTPTGIIRLFDRFKLFAMQRVIAASLKAMAVTLAYLTDADLWTFLLIWMLTEILNYLLLFTMGHYILYRNQMGKWWRCRIEKWRPLFSFNVWSNLASTLDIPVKLLDVFIVSTVVSLQAVGIYKIFKQISHIITKLADPFYQAVYPQFAILIANGEEQRAVKMALKVGALLLAVSTPIVIGMSLSSSWWLDLVFGEVYAEQWTVFSVYLALQAVSLTFISIHPLFVAMGYVQKNFLIYTLANGCFLAIAWYFGRQFGLMGIVLALGFQFGTVVSMKLFFIRQRFHIHTKRIRRSGDTGEDTDRQQTL